MTQYAFDMQGREIDALSFSLEGWEHLKLTSPLGRYVLQCCRAPAVLKTSLNGLPFFAHASNECETALETQWHKDGKALILTALGELAAEAKEEVPGKSPSGARWKADVLIQYGSRSIAIELQRSYQPMSTYLRRQARYLESGIECYWLTRVETYRTLVKSTGREVLKRFYGGKWPKNDPCALGSGLLPELPVSILHPEAASPIQIGRQGVGSAEWLTAIFEGRFQYVKHSWVIV